MNPLNLSLLQLIIALVLTGALVFVGKDVLRKIYAQSGALTILLILSTLVGALGLVNAFAN